MTTILNIIETISGLIFLASLFAMSAYLYREKIFTGWQLRTTLLWPRLIFEYRDHTEKYHGREGIWYLICKVSFLILLATVVASIAPQILLLPNAIVIVVLIFAATIIPALGYVIYGLSKEKYF